jgi:purine nucleoside phosphorylase
MLRKYHIDAVGMSTVPELLSSARYGMDVIGVSVITNLLKENLITISDHSEVLKTADSASSSLFTVINLLETELN